LGSIDARYGALSIIRNYFIPLSLKKIALDIVTLSQSVTQSHNYAVILGEHAGKRRLPIIIGGFEAQSIAVAWEKMAPNRPLTHDLFKNMFELFEVELKEVIINNLLDGVFYARLVCERNGITHEIDSRTSDAIAMAVRFHCPIFTYEFVLEAAGIVLEDTDSTEEETKSVTRSGTDKKENKLAKLNSEELHKLLDEVLNNEDYEQAASIRDEIKKRGE
jgi:uncharacterized protein